MVWVLIDPSGFGDFFPEGDYVGWTERLVEHAETTMSPQKKAEYFNFPASYVHEVAEKFVREVGTQAGDAPIVKPLEPHEQPEWFETVKPYSNLGSLIGLNDRLLAVEEALKDIIERLEPGVHMFWPITITMPKGRVYPKPYYGMVIGRFLDSFVPEMSVEGSYEKSRGYDSYSAFIPTKKYVSGLAFSRVKIGNACLWRERRLYYPDICFSDRLHAEITKAGLRIPKHIRAREIEG